MSLFSMRDGRGEHAKVEPILSTALSALGKELIRRLMPVTGPGAGLERRVHFKGRGVWSRGDRRKIVTRDVGKLIRKVSLQVTDAHTELRLIGDEGYSVDQAVTDTLMALGDISMDSLLQVYYDTERLATRLKSAMPGVTDGFTEHGCRLYDLLLDACVIQIVEYFSQNPEFVTRTVKEIYDSLGSLEGQRDRIDDAFEADYRRQLARRHDRSRLFGLGLRREDQDYPLSTAYVNLYARTTTRHEMRRGDGGGADVLGAAHRFEDLLAAHPRLFLEGPAGAGKTTLLDMLTLQLCEDDLPESLIGLRGLTPFPLRLRDFVSEQGVDLPSPAAFVDKAAPLLAGALPAEHWVSDQLKDGALVLVDGIDEVPEQHRQAVLSWLEELETEYESSRFVVTSRPAAVDEELTYLRLRRGYVTVSLEPMTPAQVDLFIDRWYESAPVHRPDADDRRERAETLKKALFTRRDLASLATNPLLCAMSCALSRTLNGELPRGRVALYRAALTMLLYRRDVEIRLPRAQLLTEIQAQSLLSQMAMWMALNGRRTIPSAVALDIIGDALPRLRGRAQAGSKQPTAEAVSSYLLERSGMLQDPTVDLLEFRHPSFQDYLAGIEVFRRNHLGFLLKNAHDPLYHDIVIMVVSQKQDEEAEQRQVLEGLMQRAEDEPERSRQLWLLAAACVADVEMVDPELFARIQDETRGLLPPTNMDEAESLAAVGDFVLDLLAEVAVSRRLTPAAAACVVMCAGRIGSAEAIGLLKHFKRNPQSEVRRELVRAWRQSQVPDQYADEILADMELADIPVPIASPTHLPLLGRLKHVRELEIACEVVDFSGIDGLSELRKLKIGSGNRPDLHSLQHLTELRFLDLSGTAVQDLGPLAGLVDLEELSLGDTLVSDVLPLAGLRKLRVLNLEGTSVQDVTGLRELDQLETLNVARTRVDSVTPLSDALPGLNIVGFLGAQP